MKTIIFLHGYSGSPDNFCTLDKILKKHTGYKVINSFLPGHGTHLKHLVKLHFSDFYWHVHDLLQKHNGEDIIIVGYSLGGQLALVLSSIFSVEKIILFSVPFSVRFPYNILWLPAFLEHKFFDKPDDQVTDKQGYMQVPGKGLSIIRKGNKTIKECARDITAPILYFESKQDPGIGKNNIELLKKYLRNTHITAIQTEKQEDAHNVLSPKPRKDIINKITSFIDS